MTTELAVAGQFTSEHLQILQQAGVIPAETPEAQARVFAQICKEKGLSPFSKEIYLMKHNTKNGVIYSNIVGVDGWRKMLQRTGEYMGNGEVKFNLMRDGSYMTMFEVMKDIASYYGKVNYLIPNKYGAPESGAASIPYHVLISGHYPLTATFEVYRTVNGKKCAFSKTVLFQEFAGDQKWKTMPIQMIEKVAKSFAYKEALGDFGSGLSVEEEGSAIEDTQVMVLSESDLQKIAEKEAAQAEVAAAKAEQKRVNTLLSDLKKEFDENPTEENRDIVAAKMAAIPYDNTRFFEYADNVIKAAMEQKLQDLQNEEVPNS